MSLEQIKKSRAALDKARQEIRDDIKEVISQECARIFIANPEITSIGWGMKTSEYNDEGMYPGINGPAINVDLDDDSDKDLMMGYDYGYKGDKLSPVTDTLKAILEEAGADILCEVWDDEYIVVAKPKTRDLAVEFESEHTGW